MCQRCMRKLKFNRIKPSINPEVVFNPLLCLKLLRTILGFSAGGRWRRECLIRDQNRKIIFVRW